MLAPISLCIINRDDEVNLTRLVSCAKQHVAQVIVADTGSMDRSVRAAQEAGADVVIDASDVLVSGHLLDFSAARERSFAPATQPWHMWLDTDDDLSDWKMLARITDRATAARDSGRPGFNVRLPYDYTWNADRSACLQSFYRERIVHRDDGWKWRRPIHEYLARADGPKTCVNVEYLRVIHLSPGARGQVNDRNLRVLRHWQACGGEQEDPGALFYYLGDEMLFRGCYQQAFDYFTRVPTGNSWYSQAQFRAGRSLTNNRDWLGAIDFLVAASERLPDVADIKWELARALIVTQQRDRAREVFNSAESCTRIEAEDPRLRNVIASALV